ncbi:NDP-hexose 2,3-dehydratase family protein [Streptomyces rubradiris]|uniref:NDP-hexose 2,3-dehydratase n=1 Tax=Streptomyces rubradiris TaxID=285531 RepID=A0ABQ3RHV9_STRRR|nr:NDP-hexose 2,3-dehydratase family protein [Streptomyces rubradiris]GHH29005.1 NDP-hexose 2,3-dehydratase [Streptomyces rubradiris]GHI55447.1 NDP-hexose 2,3-dehydratase [Streptomyces rubradiris]
MFSTTADFSSWFADRCRAHEYQVSRVPLDRLDGWRFERGTGNLVHRSGRFFSVEGLDVRDAGREVDAWQQPIIVQPEYGILGILVRRFHGVPHFLLQAKMEPGNVNLVQLSPTVQATKSNYTRVHGGKPVPYLEHFIAPHRGRVLHDALQSEQASWFLGKRNRNMVIEIDEEIELHDDFCWLTAAQISELLTVDNLVNMDTRTVLSGATPFRLTGPAHGGGFRDALNRSWRPDAQPYHDTARLLSWFTDTKCHSSLTRRRIPLADVGGWSRTDGVIAHDEGKHFTVVGVDVSASSREVASWSQVMLQPRSEGVIAFLAKPINGVMHLLVQARTETGAGDVIELAPTVHCQPANYPLNGARPRYLDEVVTAPPERIRFESVHSEEGGRFYHAQNRYMLVEADAGFPTEVPPDYAWMTLRQLTEFVRYGNYINVEARSLLTLLNFADLRAPVLPNAA